MVQTNHKSRVGGSNAEHVVRSHTQSPVVLRGLILGTSGWWVGIGSRNQRCDGRESLFSGQCL